MISSPAYLKPPLQIRVPHLRKAMSPNVTGDTVVMGAILFKKLFFLRNIKRYRDVIQSEIYKTWLKVKYDKDKTGNVLLNLICVYPYIA
jgi:hypothetical protein